MESGYREVPHTADVALEVWGRSLSELFVHAAQGLFSLAVTTEPGAPISAWRQVSLSAPDVETLLVDWLNELILLHDEHGEAYITFDATLSESHELSARIGATQAYTPRVAVKAATFHNLDISQDSKGLHTVIIFDV